ncbi:MAG TPA: CHASE3 domain-containing protein [Nitrospira sp.]
MIEFEEYIQYPKTLTQGIPVQKNGFPDLEAKIAEKPEDFRETVVPRWNEESGAMFRIVMGDQGTTMMGENRSVLAEMEGIEHGLLVEWRQLFGNMFLAMLLCLGLGGL